MLTQYVWYSRRFNAHTFCSNTNNSVHNESAIILFISATFCFFVLTEQHRTEGISNTSNKLNYTDNRL